MGLKSGREDLRKRGMIEQVDIDRFQNYNREQLIHGINANEPIERSAGEGFPKEKLPAAAESLKCILNLLRKYPADEIILWKVTLCLSAFPSQESCHVLTQIKQV